MNRKLIVGIFALAALASGAASAQYYVGAGAGVSKYYSGSCPDGASCDKTDTAAKIYGGYTFADHISAELTYYTLGDLKLHSADATTPFGAKLTGSFWGLGAAFRPDFGQGWGGVARLGAAYSIGKSEVSGLSSETRHSWQPYGGVGVTYALSRDIKLEADYDYTRLGSQATDATTGLRSKGTDDVGAFVVGATFAF